MRVTIMDKGTEVQLRRRGSTVQARRADGAMSPWGIRDWGEWRTTHRFTLREQARAYIAKEKARIWPK